jgi:MFS family permease
LAKFPKPVIYLGLVSLFTDIASEMLYPVTPIFLTTVLGSSMAVVGIIEGLAEITAGLLKGYFGALSDKKQKRGVFVRWGYGLSALVKPLPGLFPGVGTVVFSRVSDRIGKGIRTAPRDALLAGYSDGNSGAVFGFHRAMDTLGAAIGPILALILLHFFPANYTLVFIIAFVPSVFAVAFTILIKDRPAETKNKPKGSFAGFYKSAPVKYKLFLLLIVLFSLVNSSDVFLILKSKEISNSATIAILGYVFYNFIYAAVSYPVGALADKIGKKKIFIAGLVVFSLVYMGFGLTGNIFITWGLFAFYGLYASATEGVAKALVSDLIPDENRGSAIGLMTMLSSFAVMAGSFFTGILWDNFGSSFPFILSAVTSFTLAVIFIFVDG